MQLQDRLVERIYDASVRDDAWSDLVPAIADHCSARSAVILINDRVTGELSFADEFGVGTEYRRAYLQDLRQDDLRLDDLIQHPVGTVRTDTMIPRYAAYQSSRAYLELYTKLGTEHALGAFVFNDGRLTHGLRVFRSQRDGAFGSAEIARYESLLPHLARVFRIRSLRRQERRLAGELRHVLDALPWGVCLISHQGEITSQNSRARELLADAERQLCRKLRCLAQETLTSWRATGRRQHSAVIDSPDGKDGKRLHLRLEAVSPQPDWADDQEPFVMAVLANPEPRAALQAEGLAALYGLTRREEAVARHLLAGERLAETSQLLEIAFETTRSHLRNIFAKTGVSRQADLMRIGLSAPAIATRPEPADPRQTLRTRAGIAQRRKSGRRQKR